MAKIRIPVRMKELTEADAEWISLVDRPANRFPFRIKKTEEAEETETEQENDMTIKVHLREMLGLQKAEDREPHVAALIIRTEDQEALVPQFEEAGFRVDALAEADSGMTVIKQDDNFDGKDCVYFKANDDVAVAIKGEGVVKAFSPFLETSSFAETMAAGGFLPTLMIASEAMQDTVRTVLRNSEDRKAAVSKIQDVLKEFGDFVSTQVGALPDNAFKCEGITVEKAKAKAKNPDAEKADHPCPPGTKRNPCTGACEGKDKTEKAEGEDNAEAKVKGKAEGEEDPTETVEKGPSQGEVDIGSSIGDVAEVKAQLEAEAAAAAGGSDEITDAGQVTDETENSDALTVDQDSVEYDYDDPTYVAALEAHTDLEKAGVHVEGLPAPSPPMKKVASEDTQEDATEATSDSTEIKAQKAEDSDGTAGQEPAGDGGDNDLAAIVEKAVAAGVKKLETDVQALGERVKNVEKTSGETRQALDGTVLSDSDPRSETVPTNARKAQTAEADDVWAGTLTFLDRK